MRDLLFHRDFRGYSGGHGKVFDYFEHARAHPRFRPRVHFTPGSVHAGNPWTAAGIVGEADWAPDAAGALFLGGMDWIAVPTDRPDRPVINLVQGVRHADAALPLHAFLARRAIRLCVSRPVADAIAATGIVNGPVQVIDAGLRLPDGAPGATRVPGRVFVGAIKQPETGAALAARLREAGREVDLCIGWVERADYLRRLAAAERAVMLPLPREGFYLPGLEAMALGCAAVVPDCFGNRAYLDPGGNALCPPADVDSLAAAVAQLDDDALRRRLVERAHTTAARFDLERERLAFHRILDDLDALWRA